MKPLIDSKYIALTLLLPRIGRKTAFKIFNNLTFKITSYNELFDYINECNSTINTPKVDKTDLELSIKNIESVLEENEKNNIKVISFYDNNYPERFKVEKDPPILLHCIGNTSLLNHKNNIGIIGTREPLNFAFRMGTSASTYFAERGFNIVSGLAIGCDTSGHLGAININGLTTAILAHGLHTVYPKENKELAKSIIDSNGLLISEYITGTPVLPNYFVERDRLQSYLSDCIFVVQTDVKGGTMHAVKAAFNSGKKIAVAYPENASFLTHEKSRGNKAILEEMNALKIADKNDLENLYNSLVNQGISPTSGEKSNLKSDSNDNNESPNSSQLNLF